MGEPQDSYYRVENEKLKALLRLTDPVLSDVEMNLVTARQIAEFERWSKSRGDKPDDLTD